MDELDNKMGAILNNPETMQKIMALAQNLNLGNIDSQKESNNTITNKQSHGSSSGIPEGFDLSMLQRISGLAGKSSIDKNEQTLLKALSPYLSNDRIRKLEKAMRAAKMAKLASSLLGNSNLQSSFGR